MDVLLVCLWAVFCAVIFGWAMGNKEFFDD
jgi:hypothetical protein